MVIHSDQHANNVASRHRQTTKKPLRYSTNAATDASLSNHSVTCCERAGKIQHWPRSANWKKAWVEIVSSSLKRGKGGPRSIAIFVKCQWEGIVRNEPWLTDVAIGITVDFDSFQKVLNRPGGFRDPGEPEEYCRGFQVFDKDMTGFIGVGQLRYSTHYK